MLLSSHDSVFASRTRRQRFEQQQQQQQQQQHQHQQQKQPYFRSTRSMQRVKVKDKVKFECDVANLGNFNARYYHNSPGNRERNGKMLIRSVRYIGSGRFLQTDMKSLNTVVVRVVQQVQRVSVFYISDQGIKMESSKFEIQCESCTQFRE